MEKFNNGDELQTVLKIIGQEYAQLNEYYNKLLSSVSTNNPDSTNIEERTEEMKQVLAEMEKKSQMLNFLTQYKNKVADQIREAISPPKIRGAVKRVKALRLINELRSLSS